MLTVSNVDQQRIYVPQVDITGTAIDVGPGSTGVAQVRIHSAAYNLTLNATRSDQHYKASVPLILGENLLTITAQDQAGNVTTQQRRIQRLDGTALLSVQPPKGQVVTADALLIEGHIKSHFPASDLRVALSDWQTVPTATSQPNEFRFSFPNLPLKTGLNRFNLLITAPDTTIEQTLIFTRSAGEPGEFAPPALQVLSPQPGTWLTSDQVNIRGHVSSSSSAVQVTVNGTPLPVGQTNPADYYFTESVSFPGLANELTATIDATDAVGNTETFTYTWYRDSNAPVITLAHDPTIGPLRPEPAANTVLASPYTVRGTVQDDNLTSLLLNGKTVDLFPGQATGEYRFEAAVPIPLAGQAQLHFLAHDLSGNSTALNILLFSDASANLAIVLPGDNAALISQGGPIELQVAARLSGQTDQLRVFAQIDDQPGQLLSLNGTLASGMITLPATSSDYRLTVYALDAQDQRVASTSHNVQVSAESDQPVALLYTLPGNGDRLIEPEQPIELSANRALELARLQVDVRETLHGKTWINSDPSGLEALYAEGAQLVDVHRDAEPVPGSLSALPGHRLFAFYPERLYGFNSQIVVTVRYDGLELSRFAFHVRPLPTFVMGSVSDQFGQPLANIPIRLTGNVNRETRSNEDGAFAFGFQEPAGQEIPSGRYSLWLNNALTIPGYGAERYVVSLQGGQRNVLAPTTLLALNPATAFQAYQSGQASLHLANGDLQLTVASAVLRFANGQTSGELHAQFIPFDQLALPAQPGALPLWSYSIQPRGIGVDGHIELSMRLPELAGSLDYLGEHSEYLLLLGYQPERHLLSPVGVGRVEQGWLYSQGALQLSQLDHLAVTVLKPNLQPLLRAIAEGERPLQDLLRELQP